MLISNRYCARRSIPAPLHNETRNPESKHADDQNGQAGRVVPRFNCVGSFRCSGPNENSGSDDIAEERE